MLEKEKMTGKKSRKGVKVVKEFLQKQGYGKIDDVSYNSEYSGCDIKVEKDGKEIKIEVKCSEKDDGISDCYPSEFDSEKKLTANFLYIVRVTHDKGEYTPYAIDILTKEEVDKYSDKHTKVERIRVANALKTALKKENGVGKRIDIMKTKEQKKNEF